jgi:hypothetical protein
VTGGTYLIGAWRTDSFNWKDFLLTAGTGAAATTLVGKAAFAGSAVKRRIMKSVGTSMFVSSEKHLVDNLLGGEAFDRREFVIDVGFGAAEEGASIRLEGQRGKKAFAFGGLAFVKSRITARADEEPLEQGQAAKVGLWEGMKSYGIDWVKEQLMSHRYADALREWLSFRSFD